MAVVTVRPRRRREPKNPLDNDRARKALELRIQGYHYTEIAAQLGYASHSGARNAVTRLKQHIQVDPLEEAIALQSARIDEAIQNVMQFMREMPLKDKLWAVDRLVPLLKRQAELLGLDAPEKQVVAAQVLVREYGVPIDAV